MEISVLLIGLKLALGLFELNSGLALNDSEVDQKQRPGYTQARAGDGVSPEDSQVKCKLQGTPRLPIFSEDGDYVIGGVFSIHNYMDTVKHNYTTMPAALRCTGRLVRMISTIYVLVCVLCVIFCLQIQ